MLLAELCAGTLAAQPRPLPLCPGDKPSSGYSVTVDGVAVPVGRGEFNGWKTFHVAAVEIDHPVDVEVEAQGAAALRVRPRRHAIKPERDGDAYRFRLSPNAKLAVEADGLEPLFLFALPPDQPPAPAEPDVVYFGPGEHDVGRLSPRSGQTIYLAAGARVRGTLHAFEVNDVTVRGRGVWDARGLTDADKRVHGMLFERCKNVRLEGVQVRTGDWWQVMLLLCDDVHVSGVQTMSFGRNNDGIDLDGVQRLLVEDCFIGCGDDGFGWHALDAVALGEPVTRDCVAERCVIWNEHAGNGLRIGASMETGLFENLRYSDIDVLHAMNNAVMVDHSDWAEVRGVTFERFDNDSTKPLAFVAVERTRYSNANGYRDARGLVDGLRFVDARTNVGEITLRAVGPGAAIRNVVFDRCRVGDLPLTGTDLLIGESVSGVVIGPRRKDSSPPSKPPAPPPPRPLDGDTLVLDNGDEGTWAFAGQGLTVKEGEGFHAGDCWRLSVLGWGHAAVYEPRVRGRFRVEVRWRPDASGSSKTPWTVKHRGGYDTTVFSRDEPAGWASLGTFELDENSWVRLADPHYQISDGPVTADAVRFTRAP